MPGVLDDSDEEKWIYREHTAAKHEVYRKYLTPWTYKLANYNRQAGRRRNKLRIVDCFAGRGSYVDAEDCEGVDLECIETPVEYPGSPQIILDRLTSHSDKFDNAEAVFIEKDPENFEKLQENLNQISGVAENVHKRPIKGKFQEEILDIVDTDGNDYPTLFFIDPFGFKALDYDVITEIATTPQFDFLLTFMSRDINRFFDNEEHEVAIQRMFGEKNYKSRVGDYDAENWEPLVEYYTDRLEEAGTEFTFEYVITEPDSTQVIYYLVFGSNDYEGYKTMRAVMHNCGTGSFGYAPREVDHDRKQTGLGEWTSGNSDIEDYLKNNYQYQRIEFDELVRRCIQDRGYADDVESDYRQALKNLEGDGDIQVERRTSQPGGNGIQGGDMIDFRPQEDLEGLN